MGASHLRNEIKACGVLTDGKFSPATGIERYVVMPVYAQCDVDRVLSDRQHELYEAKERIRELEKELFRIKSAGEIDTNK